MKCGKNTSGKTFGYPGTAVREAYPARLNALGKGHVLGQLSHDASVTAGPP
jgi:hypothetical protein